MRARAGMSAGSGGHVVMDEGTARVGEASQEDGLLLYWVSWMATVFTIGLFSSGMYVRIRSTLSLVGGRCESLG